MERLLAAVFRYRPNARRHMSRWAGSSWSALALLLLRPIRDLIRTIRGRHAVRIFTYHRLSQFVPDDLTADLQTFRRQIRYIRRFHKVVGLEEALHILRNDARLRRPVAVLTFDDAYASVYELALPILEENGVSACCFVTTSFTGTSNRYPWDIDSSAALSLDVMGWTQLSELLNRGWSLGSHTATHPRLAECDIDTIRQELVEPLQKLRRQFDIQDIAVAFPFGGPGDVPRAAVRLAREAGYTACLWNFGGENHPPCSCWELRRIDLGGDLPTLVWKARVHGMEPPSWIRRPWRNLIRSPALLPVLAAGVKPIE